MVTAMPQCQYAPARLQHYRTPQAYMAEFCHFPAFIHAHIHQLILQIFTAQDLHYPVLTVRFGLR